MKIQVGKTYKSDGAYSYTIQALGLDGYYYGTSSFGNAIYSFDQSGRSRSGLLCLLPNKVKKEGWVARFVDSRNFSMTSNYIWATEEECRSEHPHGASYHRIEWEEDEE